ncbi:MAG: Ig-like domain-containing protein, partial [Rhodothermales bacterium]
MRIGFIAVVSVLLASCATPVPPPGGPRDETPPAVVETLPPAGQVNFSGGSLRIAFSEHVDAASLPRAFSITPAFAGPVEFAWRGRSVEIRFPEPLRENTTYVVTLDTNLRDVHSVALATPITLAFSTGATISRGIISGRVLLNDDGGPAAGIDVFAYAVPDSAAPDTLAGRPDYRTQTGQDGSFRFDYLTEQFYFVAAVQDLNRNFRPDPAERFASPPAAAVRADSLAGDRGLPWILAALDTLPPEPLRLESLSSSRHLLRLSEEVRFVDRDAGLWTLTDSASGAGRQIHDLYMRSGEPRQVYMLTPPLEPGTYSVVAMALADSSGNRLIEQTLELTPSTAADTVGVRFLSFLPDGTLSPFTLPRGMEPTLRFNTPVTAELLGSAVTVRDSAGTALVYNAVTHNGTDYEVYPEPPLTGGDIIEVTVDGAGLANPDSLYTATYERLTDGLAGEIAGIVISELQGPVVVEALAVEVEVVVPAYEVHADTTGRFILRDMPAGTYRLRVFADVDANGRWDPGALVPYMAPEGMTWTTEPVRVRARWETALP